MLRLFVRSCAFGLAGMIVVPVAVFFIVLTAAHLLDPRCGTPGDSGGCEMGTAGLAIFSMLPGLAIGVAFALFQNFRNRAK